MVLVVAIVVLIAASKVRNPLDNRPGATHQLILQLLLDRLISESSAVQRGLDLASQCIASARDLGDGSQELAIARIVAKDRPIREAQAIEPYRNRAAR